MLPVAQKYRLFGDSESAKIEVQKFQENFELIQVCLGEIERCFTNDPSRRLRLENEVKEINSRFENISQLEQGIFDVELVAYSFEWMPDRSVTIEGRKITAIPTSEIWNYVRSTTPLLPNCISSWKIQVNDQMSGYISIGVILLSRDLCCGNGSIGETKDGWSLDQDGRTKHPPQYKDVSGPLCKDEIITVVVNTNEGTIKWESSTGKKWIGYNNLPIDGNPIYPAVFVNGKCSVSLL